MSAEHRVTQLLVEWKQGNKEALDLLTPLVYNELRNLAEHYLRDERAAATLQPTALVNELYLRLVAQRLPDWESRAHFFGVAAHRMRQILVEHARRHKAQKRGGGLENVELNEMLSFSAERGSDLVALDDALNELAAVDPRRSRIIELKYFGGLTTEEISEVVGVSTATVGRELRVAQAWLARQLKPAS